MKTGVVDVGGGLRGYMALALWITVWIRESVLTAVSAYRQEART